MTKAAAETKGVAAETKEAEKLAASAAKSPKPKDEVALKKGDTGKGVPTTPFRSLCSRSIICPGGLQIVQCPPQSDTSELRLVVQC